jgi:xylulokinase
VALNARWMMQPVERLLGQSVRQLTMVGGGGNSGLWCQIFADVLGVPIRQLAEPMQANAVGAAYIGFAGLGLMDFETAVSQTRYRAIYQPQQANQSVYAASFANFVELYRRLRPLHRRINQAVG